MYHLSLSCTAARFAAVRPLGFAPLLSIPAAAVMAAAVMAVFAEGHAEVLGRRHDHAAGQQVARRLLSVKRGIIGC